MPFTRPDALAVTVAVLSESAPSERSKRSFMMRAFTSAWRSLAMVERSMSLSWGNFFTRTLQMRATPAATRMMPMMVHISGGERFEESADVVGARRGAADQEAVDVLEREIRLEVLRIDGAAVEDRGVGADDRADRRVHRGDVGGLAGRAGADGPARFVGDDEGGALR